LASTLDLSPIDASGVVYHSTDHASITMIEVFVKGSTMVCKAMIMAFATFLKHNAHITLLPNRSACLHVLDSPWIARTYLGTHGHALAHKYIHTSKYVSLPLSLSLSLSHTHTHTHIHTHTLTHRYGPSCCSFMFFKNSFIHEIRKARCHFSSCYLCLPWNIFWNKVYLYFIKKYYLSKTFATSLILGLQTCKVLQNMSSPLLLLALLSCNKLCQV